MNLEREIETILYTVLLDGSPDPVYLFEGEFTVITPEDVANRLIALSNDDYSGHNMRQYFPATMRHLAYWNDPELLAVCFRLVYDLGMVSGLRAMRKEAEQVGTRKLEDAKQWLLSTR